MLRVCPLCWNGESVSHSISGSRCVYCLLFFCSSCRGVTSGCRLYSMRRGMLSSASWNACLYVTPRHDCILYAVLRCNCYVLLPSPSPLLQLLQCKDFLTSIPLLFFRCCCDSCRFRLTARHCETGCQLSYFTGLHNGHRGASVDRFGANHTDA